MRNEEFTVSRRLLIICKMLFGRNYILNIFRKPVKIFITNRMLSTVLCHNNIKLTTLRKLKYAVPMHGKLRQNRGQLKCDGTHAETRFRLWAKRTSPFKSAGVSVQSTTSSRGVRISGSNAGYTMFWGSVKGTGYPLHSPVSPSIPLPCVTVCHHISTGVYHILVRDLRIWESLRKYETTSIWGGGG